MTAIEITFLTQKERLRNTAERPTLYLFYSIPHFEANGSPCILLNETLASLTHNAAEHIKNSLLTHTGNTYGIRFPVEAEILFVVHRMDALLISLEMLLQAKLRQKTILDKHVYLHFAENGRLPVTAHELTGKKIRCLSVSENVGKDPETGKEYPLKKKYCNKK